MNDLVHLISPDCPADALGQLRHVRQAGQRVICLGPPPAGRYRFDGFAESVHCPMNSPALAAARAAERAAAARVVCVWSPALLPAALEVADRLAAGVVVSLPARPLRPDLPALAAACQAGRAVLTVPTDCARRALTAGGVSGRCVHVVPPAGQGPDCPQQRRDRVRQELGVGDSHTLILGPGDIHRRAGQKYVSWAQAILRQLRQDLRVLFPGTGAGMGHLRFFARSTGYLDEVTFAAGEMTEADALAAADLAMIVPEIDLGQGALAAALAGGLATLVAATPEAREVGAEAVCYAPPRAPAAMSAALLKLVEDRPCARELSARALERAAALTPAAARAAFQNAAAQAAGLAQGASA